MKIALTQGQFAIIDAADEFHVRQYKWCIVGYQRYFYAFNRKNGFMHRWLLDASKEYKVLHLNNDGFDNRRINLLLGSRAEAMYKQRPQVGRTSQYKGVCCRKSGHYVAYCSPPGEVKRHLGTFNNEEDAARAYDDAAREMYGDLARTNFESVQTQPR